MHAGPRTAPASSLLERWGYSPPRTPRGRLAELLLQGVVWALWMLVALGCVGLLLTLLLVALDRSGLVPWGSVEELLRLLATTPLGLALALMGMASSFLLGVLFGRTYESPEVARPAPLVRKVSTFGRLVLGRISRF